MQPSDYEKLNQEQAIAYQHELRRSLNIKPLETPVHIIGGADISYNKYEETIYVGIVLLSFPEMKLIGSATTVSRTSFPYISGLLAFREVPAVLEVWNKLETKPDVLVLDGQGIAHERRLGIATHFGLVTGAPTIGCAKSRLAGRFQPPDNEPLAESPMYDKGEQVGVALRTKRNCNPVYISPGNNITIQQSVGIIKKCVRGYRIPEPTRQAHLLVNKIRVENGANPAQQYNLFD